MKLKMRIPRKSLKALEFYASEFSLSVTDLMQSQCCIEASSVRDDPFGRLAKLDDQKPMAPLAEITLDFPISTYSFLVRVAELLRRPLAELLGGFLMESAEMIALEMAQSSQVLIGISDPNLAVWAKMARDYSARAQKNLTPIPSSDMDSWAFCGITPTCAMAS